jgi:putative tributyrin esterase
MHFKQSFITRTGGTMAYIQLDCFSEVLGLSISMDVILPQTTSRQIGLEGRSSGSFHPTLFLLHGLSDDHTIWMRRTSIERYASPAGLAVVMPAVHRSFYTDMKNGLNYWTFVSEELPMLVRSFFPLSPKREDNFVAGLSMGGYGAFKLAFRHPDRFAAAASLSGALDLAPGVRDKESWNRREYDFIFGKEASIDNTENDLMHLLQEGAKNAGSYPSLFLCCGTSDFLYDQNVLFRDRATSLGYNLHFEDEQGTGHEWGYWDRMIEKVIKWLPLRKTDVV